MALSVPVSVMRLALSGLPGLEGPASPGPGDQLARCNGIGQGLEQQLQLVTSWMLLVGVGLIAMVEVQGWALSISWG